MRNEKSSVLTNELKDDALDWAVAKCEGFQVEHNYIFTSEHLFSGWWQGGPDYWQRLNSYSTNWAQGGPIIEREKIGLLPSGNAYYIRNGGTFYSYGETPLISAMRCYVASKLGDTVEIPKELTQ